MQEKRSREVLTTDVRVGEFVELVIQQRDGTTELVRLTLQSKSGQIARLRIDAPESVGIPRRQRRSAFVEG